MTEAEQTRRTDSVAANAGPARALRRSVSVALGLIAAVAVAAGVYRHFAWPPAPVSAGGGTAVQLGGQRFVRHAAPRPLPAVAFTNGAGRPLSLAQFRGRVILLNVWATWCAPCRREMPTLDRLQAKLGGSDFEVVALSIDSDGPDAVRKFYDDLGIRHLRIYNDATTDSTTRLKIPGVPATLLIDRAGREIGRALGPAEWDAPDVIETLRAERAAAAK